MRPLASRKICGRGEVAEWSNVPDSKSGVGASLPWVRIPPSPPFFWADLSIFVRTVPVQGHVKRLDSGRGRFFSSYRTSRVVVRVHCADRLFDADGDSRAWVAEAGADPGRRRGRVRCVAVLRLRRFFEDYERALARRAAVRCARVQPRGDPVHDSGRDRAGRRARRRYPRVRFSGRRHPRVRFSRRQRLHREARSAPDAARRRSRGQRRRTLRRPAGHDLR